MKIFIIFIAVLCLSLISLVASASTLTSLVTNSQGEQLVADAYRRTLYVFDADLNQTVPACNGDCAEVWPPYLLTDQDAASLSGPLGKIIRMNGRQQLTYEGRPVYTYAYDRSVGDDLGNAVGGVWHSIVVGDIGK
ncbi:COG4315 family predicted lipoprotein [Bdellovibrio reynosensis]|uniref:Lipoprotein n=1 Tax=Bdellovibrio reynosensis TaxID=2835041 RepID=A0ABY4CAR3_9BACT|nr:hypothetical protein [Bdellovibrio reynosensis]UOF00598.1 hypothetical protein MNR06_12910 [Bdellovibrio reynosensis]